MLGRSSADGGAECVGEGLAEALDVGVVFGLDHDAGELLRAGIAQDDASIFAERGLGFGERAGDLGKSFERRLGFYFDVDDDLRVILEAFDERFDFAVHGNERSNFDGGEKAIAGGTIFQKNNVAGLLAANDIAAAQHFFEDVAISNGSAGEGDAFACEDTLEAEIGHGRGDDTIALELVLRFEVARDGEKNAIPVNDFARFADEEGAVGISIEGHAELGALGDHALLQTFEMKRAAAGVDVAAVGRHTHREDLRAERAEEFGTEFVGGAVGAVQKDAEAGKFGSRKDAAAKKIEILGVERFVGYETRRIFRRGSRAMFQNISFEFFFDGIRELHARVGEELHAIVVVRIVRGGDDDAGLKIVLANETGDAGSGDNAGKSDGGSGLREAGGEESGDMRSGFTCIHANENVSGGMFAEQIGGEGTSGSKKSGVVERRSAGNAANTVGSEEFFGHEG